MIDTSISNLRFNTIMSLLYKPLSMLISFLYVPVVLNYLGTEKYGIWATILSILSWINYFDLGIGNGLRNKLAEALSKEPQNTKLHISLISSSYFITSILVTILVFVVVLGGYYINWNFVFGIPESNGENLYLLSSISFLCVCVAFVFSLCRNVCYALQKAHLCNLFGLIKQVLLLITVCIASKLLTANLMVIAVLYGTSSIFSELLMNFYIFRKNRMLTPHLSAVNWNLGRKITTLGIKFFIIQVAGLVLFTTDNLIVSHLYGPTQVTYYTTVNKLFTVIITVFSTAIQPFWSAIRAESVSGNQNKVQQIIRRIFSYFAVASLFAIILVFVFKPISKLWLGQELDYPKGLIISMMVYAIVYIWCSGMASVTNGLEMMRGPMIIAIIQGIVNIPLSVLFAQKFGMGTVGVLWGTIVAMLVSAFVTPIWIIKSLHMVHSD